MSSNTFFCMYCSKTRENALGFVVKNGKRKQCNVCVGKIKERMAVEAARKVVTV